MDSQLDMFTKMVDRIGLLGFLVVFGTIFFWRYMPSLLRKWKAQEEQASIVAAAVPKIEESLMRMAEGNEMLKEILEATKRVDANVTTLLGRD